MQWSNRYLLWLLHWQVNSLPCATWKPQNNSRPKGSLYWLKNNNNKKKTSFGKYWYNHHQCIHHSYQLQHYHCHQGSIIIITMTVTSMIIKISTTSFPDGSDLKKSMCNGGDLDLIPGLERSPGEGNGNSLQYSCLENSMDRGARKTIVHGVAKEWDTIEPLTLSFTTSLPLM